MSFVNQCSWSDVAKDEHLNRVNEIINKWNMSTGIQEIHGKASLADGQFGGSYHFIDSLLKSRVDEKLNFHPDC